MYTDKHNETDSRRPNTVLPRKKQVRFNSAANERGCAKVGFPYVRKARKDYRLEVKWEENDGF